MDLEEIQDHSGCRTPYCKAQAHGLWAWALLPSELVSKQSNYGLCSLRTGLSEAGAFFTEDAHFASPSTDTFLAKRVTAWKASVPNSETRCFPTEIEEPYIYIDYPI